MDINMNKGNLKNSFDNVVNEQYLTINDPHNFNPSSIS